MSEFSPVTVNEFAVPVARGPYGVHDVDPCCWYSTLVSVRMDVPFDHTRSTEFIVGLLAVRPYGAATSVETVELVVVGADEALPFTVEMRKK